VATAPVVEARLRELREAGHKRVVLDLGGLSFMDSSGVSLAVRWARDASADGFDFALLPGMPNVQRVFELTGLADRLPFGVRSED
jgi:anti-sigma B factor antagonist